CVGVRAEDQSSEKRTVSKESTGRRFDPLMRLGSSFCKCAVCQRQRQRTIWREGVVMLFCKPESELCSDFIRAFENHQHGVNIKLRAERFASDQGFDGEFKNRSAMTVGYQ